MDEPNRGGEGVPQSLADRLRSTPPVPEPAPAAPRDSFARPAGVVRVFFGLQQDVRDAPYLRDALPIVAEALAEVTDSYQAAARVVDANGHGALLAARYGPPIHRAGPHRCGIRESVFGWVVRNRTPILNRPVSRQRCRAWAPGAVLAVPVVGRTDPIGVLAATRADGSDYQEHHLEIARAVATLVAPRLETLRWQHLADTDERTNLPNSRWIARCLGAEVDRATVEGGELSVIAIDLDHFRRVNDRFGHPAGNDVLRAAAARLRRGCRSSDAIGRNGGEEFLVLLPRTGSKTACEVAERLRLHLRTCPITVRTEGGTRSVSVTGSFGVATLRPGESPGELEIRADAALYRAKRAGRDRVERHEPPPYGG